MKRCSLVVQWALLAVILVLAACDGDDDGGTPGDVWTIRLFGPGSSQGLAWNGTHLISVGDKTLASRDALVWKRVQQLPPSHEDVAWDGRSFVSVGHLGGIIETSPDGLSWRFADLGSGEDLNSVVGSGTTWVAVGQQGFIRTSPDGFSWTTRSSPTTATLNSVAWTGSQFIAVGDAGTIVTSPDGTNWTLQPSPTSNPLTSVAASSSLIVATTGLGSGGSPYITLSSPDGITWTSGLSSIVSVFFAGGRFVAVGAYWATSLDGLNWTLGGTPPDALNQLVHTGEQYVAIGTSAAFTSPDGLSWSRRTMHMTSPSIARSPTDGRMVAVGGTDTSQTSLDGITWEFGALERNDLFRDVVWSPSAGAFIGLVQIGVNYSPYRSIDGKSWAQLGYALCSGTLAASETMLVNVGVSLTGPCVATSSDGTSWTEQSVPAGLSLRKAFWTGSQFVAVGVSGAIATSPDGITWTARMSGVAVALHGGAAAPSTLVIVGDSGTILSSSDGGETWVPRTSGVAASLERVVWTGTEFFAVGSNGTVLSSSDGMTWTPKPWVPEPHLYTTDLNDIAWSPTHGRLTLVGAGGLTATSP